MKNIFYILFILLISSCVKFINYTEPINEINYSYSNEVTIDNYIYKIAIGTSNEDMYCLAIKNYTPIGNWWIFYYDDITTLKNDLNILNNDTSCMMFNYKYFKTNKLTSYFKECNIINKNDILFLHIDNEVICIPKIIISDF